MAKSIRSKIKRKHRAEFRRTIGSVAYESQMKKVQTKLQQNSETQTMKSLDRLSETLMTNNNPDPENESTMAVDIPEASDTRETDLRVEDCRGENKAPVSKRSRRKNNPYRAKNEAKASESATTEKRRPRFFCQF